MSEIDYSIPPPNLDAKRIARMNRVDELSPEICKLVHAYSLNVVLAFIDCGVIKHRHIRHLVETVLDEFSPTRGSYAKQGMRTKNDR